MAEPLYRVRDAAAKRTAILAAARARFGHESYDRVELQEIAADSNVDVSLIIDFFGSKEGLLSDALVDALYPSVLMDGDRSTFGRRLMGALTNDGLDQHELDYFLLLLRVTMVPELQPILEKLVQDRLMLPFAAWIGGPDAALRARLVFTVLMGTSAQNPFSRDLCPPEETKRFQIFFADLIQTLIEEPLG